MKTFKPQLVAVRNESVVDELKEALADVEEKPEIIPGEEGVVEVPCYPIPHLYFGSKLSSLLIAHIFFSGCSPSRCCQCSYRNSRMCRFKGKALVFYFFLMIFLATIFAS